MSLFKNDQYISSGFLVLQSPDNALVMVKCVSTKRTVDTMFGVF